MESDKFRELLIIAKEQGVSMFRNADVEVHFAFESRPNAQGNDMDSAIDPEEEFLKKIEQIKTENLANLI